MTQASRRALFKNAANLLIGAGLGTVTSAQAEQPEQKSWDETYDIVVIGSGFAGLAAAIEARQAGASVIVLENPFSNRKGTEGNDRFPAKDRKDYVIKADCEKYHSDKTKYESHRSSY